jgi:hypothetical protein
MAMFLEWLPILQLKENCTSRLQCLLPPYLAYGTLGTRKYHGFWNDMPEVSVSVADCLAAVVAINLPDVRKDCILFLSHSLP